MLTASSSRVRDRYGIVLALILGSLAFQLAAPDEHWAVLVTIGLQSATLLAALHASGVHSVVVRAATVFAVVAVLVATGVLIGSGEIDRTAGRTVSLLVVVLAPPAILIGTVRQVRAAGRVTVTTMLGALCVYLLLGMAFAFAYGVVGAIDEDFFAQTANAHQRDYLYFSFTTMTTTGYGDLTAASDVGRSLAITESLIGQIYLVTIVAVIVGNLRPRGPRSA